MIKNIKRDNCRHPGIIFPPPLIITVLIGIGVLADKYLRLQIADDSGCLKTAGHIFIAMWALITLPTVTQMIRHSTTFSTHGCTSKVLTTGFYGISRNPLYVSLFFVMAAISFYANSYWFILMIPVLWLLLNRLVVVREEKFLEEKFAEEYLQYKAKVRRWI